VRQKKRHQRRQDETGRKEAPPNSGFLPREPIRLRPGSVAGQRPRRAKWARIVRRLTNREGSAGHREQVATGIKVGMLARQFEGRRGGRRGWTGSGFCSLPRLARQPDATDTKTARPWPSRPPATAPGFANGTPRPARLSSASPQRHDKTERPAKKSGTRLLQADRSDSTRPPATTLRRV